MALVGYMQRDLVERRGWFTKDGVHEVAGAVAACAGPLAAQVAICLGYVHSRVWGATLVALAFILPSFVMTLAIGWLYVRFGGSRLDAGGLLRGRRDRHRHHQMAACKLAKLTMAKDRLQWVIFAVMAVVTAWTESEIGCAVRAARASSRIVAQAPPAWLRRPRAGLSRGGGSPRSCSPRSCGSSPRRAPSSSAAGWPSCRSCTAASCRSTAGSTTSSSSTPSRSPC